MLINSVSIQFMREINALGSYVWKNMSKASQITIDAVQDAEDDFNRDEAEEPITRDELGSACYDLSLILDVIDPKMEFDIEVLTKLHDIIDKWRAEVEFVDKALGLI